MINLLPPEVKEDYRYGLRNSALLNWVAAFVVALIGMGVIATYGLLTLQNSTHTYDTKVADSKQVLKDEDLDGTEKQVKEVTTNLKLVVQVLSKEILFSKLLQQVAIVIPSNSRLKDLNISQTTGGIDLTAEASDYQTASQVQVNLQDPHNGVFSKADIVSIQCASNPEDPKYPCTVTIRALFGSNNPYLFVNSKAAN